MVQVVDEVVGEQLQVRRRLGERDAPRSEGPASAQGHGPLHGLRPQGRQIALRERLSEAHGEVFRAQAEQGQRLRYTSQSRREEFRGLIGRGRFRRAGRHARVHNRAQRWRGRPSRRRRREAPRIRGGAGRWPRHRRLLWPLLEQRENPFREAVR